MCFRPLLLAISFIRSFSFSVALGIKEVSPSPCPLYYHTLMRKKIKPSSYKFNLLPLPNFPYPTLPFPQLDFLTHQVMGKNFSLPPFFLTNCPYFLYSFFYKLPFSLPTLFLLPFPNFPSLLLPNFPEWFSTLTAWYIPPSPSGGEQLYTTLNLLKRTRYRLTSYPKEIWYLGIEQAKNSRPLVTPSLLTVFVEQGFLWPLHNSTLGFSSSRKTFE